MVELTFRNVCWATSVRNVILDKIIPQISECVTEKAHAIAECNAKPSNPSMKEIEGKKRKTRFAVKDERIPGSVLDFCGSSFPHRGMGALLSLFSCASSSHCPHRHHH